MILVERLRVLEDILVRDHLTVTEIENQPEWPVNVHVIDVVAEATSALLEADHFAQQERSAAVRAEVDRDGLRATLIEARAAIERAREHTGFGQPAIICAIDEALAKAEGPT